MSGIAPPPAPPFTDVVHQPDVPQNLAPSGEPISSPLLSIQHLPPPPAIDIPQQVIPAVEQSAVAKPVVDQEPTTANEVIPVAENVPVPAVPKEPTIVSPEVPVAATPEVPVVAAHEVPVVAAPEVVAT